MRRRRRVVLDGEAPLRLAPRQEPALLAMVRADFGSGLEHALPIEHVEPGLLDVLRRDDARNAVQLGDRRVTRRVRETQPRLSRRAGALAHISTAAHAREAVPTRPRAAR